MEFNLDERLGFVSTGNYDSRETEIKKLEEGKKYEYNRVVVQGKKGKLYFSSPDFKTRGWVSSDGWRIMEAG